MILVCIGLFTSIGESLIGEAVVLSCLNVFGFDQSSSLELKG